MPSPCADAYVLLQGGYTAPVPALRLLWSLEDRGCSFEVTADDAVVVRPGRLLTEDDKAALRTWKRAVINLVRYEPVAVS